MDVIFSCRLLPGESLEKFRPNAEVAEACWFDPNDLPPEIPRGQQRLIKVALEQADEWDGYVRQRV